MVEIDPENYLVYSNRSAAYLKAGKFDLALKDANQTISLKPTYHKGYGRKGAAYHAMKKYDQSVAAYKEGLKVCPDEEQLKMGLASAKRARLDGSKANKAARKTESTRKASRSRSKKARKAPTVSAFVQQTRAELALQMAAIQAQLDLINELAAMSDEEKSDLLFNLIDRDGDGTVDASELAAALRKRNTDLSFGDSLERAITMVAAFDTDGDAKLDTEEFATFISAMLTELQLDFHEFSEFLVLQLLFSDTDDAEEAVVSKEALAEKVKAHEELMDMLQDPRLVDLFKMFDKDGSRELDFFEVAVGLYQMSLDMDESAQTTMEVLLMMDQSEKRTLNYEQFARLILAVVASAGTTFDEIADDLTLALAQNAVMTEDDLAKLMVANYCYDAAKEIQSEIKKESMVMDALSYGRLQKLFDLWDVNGDGDISFEELTDGLRVFQEAAGIQDNAEKHAEILLSFDTDGDQALGRKEFAHAMLHYADLYKTNLHELIDFMCVTTVLGNEKTKAYQNAFRQSLIGTGNPDVKPAFMEYYEAPGEDDFFE